MRQRASEIESEGETEGKRGVRRSFGLQLWKVVMGFVAVVEDSKECGRLNGNKGFRESH